MRCLFIQSAGLHDGKDGWTRNDHLKEAKALDYAAIENGWKSVIWGKGYSNYNECIDFDTFDFIMCVENYDFNWVPDLKNSKAVKAYWCIDLHCQSPQIYAEICKNYDIILHSTKSLIDNLKSILPDKKHIWFPNCVDSRYFADYNKEKTKSIVFVGSLSEQRKDFIEKLQKDVGLQYFFYTGSDMIDTIAETKIHFNKNISCDINGRTFETIGLGICLITNQNSEMEELGFIDGMNCIVYSNYEEAVLKIRESLASKSWQQIGKNAALLSKEHTYTKRLKSLISLIQESN